MRARPVATIGAGIVLAAVGFLPAAAQSGTSGPQIDADRTELAPGEFIELTLSNFTAESVTISSCGNEARRGSPDCNMVESEGRWIPEDRPAFVRMPVGAPPVPCPCVLRVASQRNDEVAILPITLTGHPVADLTSAPPLQRAIDVSIDAEPLDKGAVRRIRSSLGGSSTYQVEVRIRNVTSTPVRGIRLSASAGRTAEDDRVVLATDPLPDELPPGQSWSQVIETDVPAPVFGVTTWYVVVSGSNEAVEATDTTSNRPLLLYVMVAIFGGDLVLLIGRAVRRRLERRRTEEPDVIDLTDRPAPPTWILPREPEPDEMQVLVDLTGGRRG